MWTRIFGSALALIVCIETAVLLFPLERREAFLAGALIILVAVLTAAALWATERPHPHE